MLEEKSREERYPDIELEEDLISPDEMDKHCKGVTVENKVDKGGGVHALIWQVYMKEKDALTKR